MMKFCLNYFKIPKRCHSEKKWSVPKELLSSSISSKTTKNHHILQMEKLLRSKFPKAEAIEVTDLSGNCGSMFEVVVVSEEFRGLPLVKQHMLVTDILSKDIKNMHGIRIETKVPDAKN